MSVDRRAVLGLLPLGAVAFGAGRLWAEPAAWQPAEPHEAALVAAGEAQVGVTTVYDPAYVALDFPGGDVPRDRGVCTDVVIRGLRDALGLDLQALVNRDMKANFAAYPKHWGLARTDRNIDHRRVPNLETFLARQGADLPIGTKGSDFRPGDIVASVFPNGLTHIVIVTNRPNRVGDAPLIVHNVGAGARIEDRLFEWQITGHFRLTPAIITALGGQVLPS